MSDPDSIAPAAADDASIVDMLAGLDPPTSGPRAFDRFADEASCITALNAVHLQGGITASEMAELLEDFRMQLARATPTEA